MQALPTSRRARAVLVRLLAILVARRPRGLEVHRSAAPRSHNGWMGLMAAAYIRVSSRSQNHATQRDAILRAASARGDRITQWFEERRSAKKLDRPMLASVRELARRGDLPKLYVFRL